MKDEQQHALVALLERIGRHGAGPAPRRDAEAALRELYELAGGRVHAVALRVLGNREWAEDVLQETFLQVWRTAGDYRAALSPPLAWLGLMARSRALDFLRRRASDRADAPLELDDALSETIAGDAVDPADAHSASQHARALHDCLRQLQSRERELLSLAYFRDLSHAELAQGLKLPLGSVKSWLRRAVDRLRTCMGRFA